MKADKDRLLSLISPWNLVQLASSLTLSWLTFSPTSIQAQLIPDTTLDNESSVVNNGTPDNIQIQGGAIRGANLFHSFQEFNVNPDQTVLFVNPAGIANILTRVTGSNISQILGTLGVAGRANLFFINPNGIYFGNNARLELTGSFLASTANRLIFGNNIEFSAANPKAPPLLTINLPVGLQFGAAPGNITSKALLEMRAGQSIGLLGGNITVQGGRIIAKQGGQIELGAVGSNSFVTLNLAGNAFALGYNNVPIFQDIQLLQGALVGATGAGSNTRVTARQLAIRGGAQISASALGDVDAGNILVRTSDSIIVNSEIQQARGLSASGIFSQVESGAAGNGGNITLETRQLRLEAGGQISTGTLPNSRGRGGTLSVNASESVEVVGISPTGLISGLFTESQGQGNAGDLRINTGRLTVRDTQIRVGTEGSGQSGTLIINAAESVEVSGIVPDGTGNRAGISVSTGGTGNSGDLLINTKRLTLQDGGSISAATFGNSGRGGNLVVRASESVEVRGTRAGNGSRLFVGSEGTGNGGNLRIETGRLTVREGGFVSAATAGSGQGGTLEVKATESVEVTGMAPEGQLPSRITVESTGSGNAGNLQLETPRLTIREGGAVSAATRSSGGGGALQVRSNTLEVSEGAVLTTESTGSGPAGDLSLEAEQLTIREGGTVSAATRGSGRGGALQVRSNRLEVRGTASRLTAETEGSGDAGDLEIDTRQFRVREGGEVSTATRGPGLGGSLQVRSEDVEVSGNDSRLTAETTGPGQAGDLQLNTQTLTVREGGAISAATQDTGRGGTLNVRASERIEVSDNNSRLTAEATRTGNAGDLQLETQQLNIRNGATVSVSSTQAGAGNLTISAPQIRLETGRLTATTAAGSQGNIRLDTTDLQLRDNSDITTNATGSATGGNIQINAETLVAGENSEITAQAEDGRGGNIRINTEALIQSPDSSIDASSQRGIDGTVEINRPEADPAAVLTEQDLQPVNPETLIASGCTANERPEASRLIITRLGGIPPNPDTSRITDTFWVDFQPLTPSLPTRPETLTPPRPLSLATPLTEAKSWTRNAAGELILSADPQTENSYTPWYPDSGCHKHTDLLPPRTLLAQTSSPRRSETPIVQNIEVAGSIRLSRSETPIVQNVEVAGSTLLSRATLQQTLAPFLNRPLSFSELLAARSAVSELYFKAGYITSRAYLRPQTVRNGTATIQVVEDRLRPENIQVKVKGRLNPDYIRSRLAVATEKGLNIQRLREALQQLELDQTLIQQISAELSYFPTIGKGMLTVDVVAARPFRAEFGIDNSRTPSIGSFNRQVQVNYANLLGIGDRLSAAYGNTEGSHAVDLLYSVPVNPHNGTLSFRYGRGRSTVVESPFDRLDIKANSQTYELTFRQPLLQSITNQAIREFALGITAGRRESETSVLGEPFPLSLGADEKGKTRLSILRFFQDWTHRDDRQVVSLRSEFSLGLGVFGSTLNTQGADSRFFSWRGQGVWARNLGRNTLLLVNGQVQLAGNRLVSLERFGLGGADSVRGYRQDALLTDNGVLGSVELRLPIYWFSPDRVLQIAPFLDVGAGWNEGGRGNPEQKVLVSTGLGLRFRFGNRWTVRFDWGMPLIELNSRKRTWQENGLHFSIGSELF